MNKFGSNAEISENDFIKPDQNCTAVDKTTGELCGETESLKIFNEFQKLYEDRVARVDHELKGEFERACMKLQIMGEWIRDLGEQNIMLVHTVEDLEQTACSRVKLLEEKLQQSSTIVSANMRRSNHTQEEINKLSNRVSELEHDIGGLLELIRRARQEHHWNMDGITFNIVQPCNIPAPVNCSCDQEETSNEQVHALKLQVEQQQENERKLIEHEGRLKKELADLTKKLVTKEDTIKDYVAQLYNFSNSVKRHSKLSDEVFHSSLVASDAQESPNIVLMADIVENVLVEKDLEIRELERRLRDAESQLVIGSNEKNMELNHLSVQLSAKNKETQKIERQMCCLQEEFLQVRKSLTAEVTEKHDTVISLRNQLAALQEQYRSATMEIHFKEDIIKKMRTMLKQAPMKETHILQNVCVDTNVFQEDIEMTNSCRNHQDQIIPYLIKTKLLMESEKEMLSNCKLELEQVIEKLQENEGYDNGITSIYKKLHDIEILLNNYKTQVINYPECAEDLKNCLSVIESQVNCLPKMFQNKFLEHHRNQNELAIEDIKRRLITNVECVTKMYLDKEETTAMINSVVKMINKDCVCKKTMNVDSNPVVSDHLKLIEVFRDYAIEAQATTEDMKGEIGMIVSTSKSQHQRYNELSKKATNIQDQLRQVREGIIETVTKLQLQEEERTRHNERITSGRIKLKDIKNEINHAQVQLASRITDMQETMQEQAMSNYTQICICNNLLGLVTEEIDNVSSNLLVFQTQDCCTSSMLRELQKHLYCMQSSMKELQKKTDEVILEQGTGELTFYERGRRLEKLERELDIIHMKMQDALEAFLSVDEQVSNNNITKSHSQEVDDIFRTKQDMYKLKKECDEWKHKALQKSPYAECDEKQWKYRVADLQDQVKALEHETKCNQETNDFLRNSIESMEKELRCTQTKAENYRRSHSIESMEYMKKIIELENAIKTQKETECTLRQHLDDSEIELKKSKELFNSLHTEYGAEGVLLNSGCNQLKYETMNINQVFKTLQSAMQSTKSGLQDFKVELKKLIYEDSSSSCSSTKSVMSLIDQLQKYEEGLDYCSQEIEKLRNTVYNKDKLLENRDEIIRIQKNSIVITQAELKELHQKLQEKIDAQNQTIFQYEKEKGELLKQNELQIQTIGHLQKAVVEAKRCIDQMEQKAMSDLHEKNKSIRELTMCVEESQSLCNECFAEAIKQDKLLELHRDGINDLQNKICRIENGACATITLLNAIYYSVLITVKEQLAARVNDFRMLKHQVDTLVQSRNTLENKYHTAKRSWREAEEKLQEFKEATLKNERATKICKSVACQSKIELEDKDCSTQDAEFNINDTQHELQSEINILARENEDLKRQLQKWKLDFDIIDKELKVEKENDSYAQRITGEIQKMRDVERSLRSENDQLKQMEVNDLHDQVGYNEAVIREQSETIEEFQKKLNAAENMISIQRGRIQSLKSLLKEKSDKMVHLQADYEVVKNDNSILRNENNVFENRAREDVCLLKKKLKQVQLQLCFTEDNYHRVTQDFNRTQANLSVAVKREADLQEILTNTEKDFCSKLMNAERENGRLEDLVHKLSAELENVQQSYTSKNAEYLILHNTYKSYAEEVDSMQLQIEKEREKLLKAEDLNRCLMQQLKECVEQNCSLMREKAAIEQNNCQNITELRELLELKKEYQLKNKSLACISAELTQTVISRSELCNESQYMVSCIRAWMEEQKKNVENLATKLKFKQQQLLQLGFEKKAFLVTIKELRRVNYLLTHRLKRTVRPGRCIKNLCTGSYMSSIAQQNLGVRLPHSSNRLRLLKKCTGGLINATRRTSVCGNPCWFPKMEYLTNEMRKNNLWCNEENTETALEESRDCGYQSSTSK